MQVLQQDDVDLPDHFRGPVVALHQLLARAPGRRVGEPELVRERALQVEHEAILAPAREIVEPHPQRAYQPLLPRHGARLLQRDQPGAREIAPSAPETGGARDPQDRVQVAQPARAFLDVGLEVVGGVVILEMSLLLLEHLRFVERQHVHRRGKAAAESAMQSPGSGYETVLEQARRDRDIDRHLVDALGDRAHAVADVEPGIPEHADQAFDERGVAGVGRSGQQDQDIDVGVREELAPPVAADGHQRGVGRRARGRSRCRQAPGRPAARARAGAGTCPRARETRPATPRDRRGAPRASVARPVAQSRPK